MNKFSSHHAFLVSGSRLQAENLYNELLKDKSIEVSFIYEKNFGVDSAKEIKSIVSQTTLKSVRYIIASAYVVGHEAQNALLKTLEELPSTKKIIFFVENTHSLLSTFISRFSKESNLDSVDLKKDENSKKTTYSIQVLLQEVEDICKAIKDEESTKSVASQFLDKLIIYKKSDLESVKKLLYFKSCIGKPSASVKQILESAVAIGM
jgi:DNA polymerase III delta prime subunit